MAHLLSTLRPEFESRDHPARGAATASHCPQGWLTQVSQRPLRCGQHQNAMMLYSSKGAECRSYRSTPRIRHKSMHRVTRNQAPPQQNCRVSFQNAARARANAVVNEISKFNTRDKRSCDGLAKEVFTLGLFPSFPSRGRETPLTGSRRCRGGTGRAPSTTSRRL